MYARGDRCIVPRSISQGTNPTRFEDSSSEVCVLVLGQVQKNHQAEVKVKGQKHAPQESNLSPK